MVDPIEFQTATNHDLMKPPFEGEKLAHYLIDLLNRQTTPIELEKIRKEFESIYKQLPEVSYQILSLYNEELQKYDLKPGRTDLYMVGGRIKGEVLKADSDIDLLIGVEDDSQSASRILFDRFPGDPLGALDFRDMVQQQILGKIGLICSSRALPIPNKFHIHDFGSKIPRTYIQSPTSLLIATYPLLGEAVASPSPK